MVNGDGSGDRCLRGAARREGRRGGDEVAVTRWVNVGKRWVWKDEPAGGLGASLVTLEGVDGRFLA
jgi:hypothetical protein